MPRALLSVSDKAGIVEFAHGLQARGFELVSTGGTAAALERAGLRVLGISTVTGFPEMLDGRVKTLHPHIHGGILARRSRPDDLAAIARHDIALIDLVVVNLYPFVKAAQNPDTPFENLIEEIDIGGPSLVRAAAKNFADVLVVVSPADYASVLEALDRPGRTVADVSDSSSRARRSRIPRATTRRSRRRLSTVKADDAGFTRAAADAFPESLAIDLRKVRDLRYGENPHQQGALYTGVRTSSRLCDAAGQGALVHQPAGSRRGDPDRARVQANRPPRSSSTRTRAVPRPDRVPPMPMCARARPTRSRPSALQWH